MKERTEVPVEQTWDLTLLFKTEEDYKKSIEFYKQLVENFCKTFENQINTVDAIHQSLADYREILELRGKIVQYASLAVNANTKDREAQNRLAQTRKVVAECDATLSFFSPELSQLEEDLLAEASQNPENKIYLERLLEDKQHLLSKEVESVLAALGNTLDFPYQNYNDIKYESGVVKLLINSQILVVNRFSGIASVYNLDTDEHITDIPGEVVNIQNVNGEIKLRGIQNNTAFYWSNKDGLITHEMDEACAQTALSFNDINLYNENTDILMMIRNNETDRKCYVVDFSTGRLKMTLSPAVKDYNVNGHISPDGKQIAIDQNYYVNYDKDSAKSTYYIVSTVYKLLNEDEISNEIDGIIAGRKLSDEEKVQIGIIAK